MSADGTRHRRSGGHGTSAPVTQRPASLQAGAPSSKPPAVSRIGLPPPSGAVDRRPPLTTKPEHTPFEHSGVVPPHAGPLFVHCPVDWHDWGCSPAQPSEPGLHSTQAPLRHTGVGALQGEAHPPVLLLLLAVLLLAVLVLAVLVLVVLVLVDEPPVEVDVLLAPPIAVVLLVALALPPLPLGLPIFVGPKPSTSSQPTSGTSDESATAAKRLTLMLTTPAPGGRPPSRRRRSDPHSTR